MAHIKKNGCNTNEVIWRLVPGTSPEESEQLPRRTSDIIAGMTLVNVPMRRLVGSLSAGNKSARDRKIGRSSYF